MHLNLDKALYYSVATGLSWDAEVETLATKEDYELNVDSNLTIYNTLQTGDIIVLAEGLFQIDNELGLIPLPWWGYENPFGCFDDKPIQACDVLDAKERIFKITGKKPVKVWSIADKAIKELASWL